MFTGDKNVIFIWLQTSRNFENFWPSFWIAAVTSAGWDRLFQEGRRKLLVFKGTVNEIKSFTFQTFKHTGFVSNSFSLPLLK